ncbi:MAG: malto-oligosyltrehalose trehalohydrolase [Acidobacteriaceae bacterium]|nr:malto-oligosyltrehalose trehalohydrolase [Acidobacteriaceae bacterium]MBV8573285.1 malto-oligosyltrehalose trehalohydrolase [Acidobacteriaceae bacterium]
MSHSHVLVTRQMPVGAEPSGDGGVNFRVWAPVHETVRVIFENGYKPLALNNEGNGYFSGTAQHIPATDCRYKYELSDGEVCPDPASRYQPEGPHGFSQVIDSSTFAWSDDKWKGVRLAGKVIYELHLGTFTQEGTWGAAERKLEYLRDTGVTLLEIMPVAEFAGRFGWGYDGVLPYACTRLYGTPDEMRSFVNKAHRLGIGVILDVVYNHLGPDGNYLPKFSPFYFSKKHATDWGEGINFDGECSRPVRDYFRENAAYWVREFHLDGLRLDATQDIHDDSDPHILTEITQAARAAAAGRPVVIIGENEPQETMLIKRIEDGGYGLDALWNDDYHHSAVVALTAKADAYYTDYHGTPQEFVSSSKYGYLYQGQWYRWQKKRRGSPALGMPRAAMVHFLENHDQIANSGRGQRIHQLTSPGLLRAMTALTLLGPGTPMIFQGQEFAASGPFLFFADHKPELAEKVRQGRVEFLEQWRALRMPDMKTCLADPCSEETFQKSKLDFSDVEKNHQTYRLHQDLLRLRREDPVLSRQGADGIDGAVLSPHAFALRFFSPGFQQDRLLVVNLGIDLRLDPSPEPLLAPPAGAAWEKLWSSDDPPYGGCGTAPLDTTENWIIPGWAAVVLRPISEKQSRSHGTADE